MSRLDELIAEYCPDGVEYKRIDELSTISRGKVMSKDFLKENAGSYPVYSSQTENDGQLGAITTYMFDGEYLTWTTDGANAGTVFYRNGKFSITNVCGILDVKNDIVYTKYLYHVLNREAPKYVSSGMGNPKLMSNVMSRIIVPVPPLPVQREIVRILDNFTELTAELTAELIARKKQYEYYRDGILSFKDENVEWHTIGEIFEVRNGYTPSKKVPEYWKNGTVPWFRLEDIRANGRKLFDAIQHVHFSGIKKTGLFKKKSIMISTTATLGEHALICTDYLSNQQLTNLTVNDAYRDKLLPEFAFYYCFVIDKLCESVANYSGGIPIVDQNKFKALLFPIPSIERQIQIVSLLDRFDNLCNDMQSGLPAEIEARQKQYEYYRDKLLTFKELKN